ncbi:nicotinate-nucleotide adenylyltransferase [Buchnera aphidicola (Hyadaphis tataricae)]|uniref:Probable nicotinate-nucleotide adenylyltransferase n=1 Tax=Buchnera aphidicola (Hyadaphis tataricae) TaxID=1241859 RepID=A0A4D6Y6M2_9GAMM|nr:nicotinate-nucleotide adenylyltransferase [Buchnera aphidicola]QCI21731.1 nicotinate-nucleotide adenylyltransferase [Buchnera aphidicola (Hyadaphis tataricae)]
MNKLYAIFGGNFDPIHYGHILSVNNLAKEISINHIIFLPNNNPPHREKTKTSIIDRINMIKIAIKKNTLFKISYLETKKKQIFYTINTLKKIRKNIGFSASLCLIIGQDHLQHLHLWKDWQEILRFSHLLILPRICKNINYTLEKWIQSHIVSNYSLLHEQSSGLIYFSNINRINISSTIIRYNYLNGISCNQLLPDSVNQYILSKKLYF